MFNKNCKYMPNTELNSYLQINIELSRAYIPIDKRFSQYHNISHENSMTVNKKEHDRISCSQKRRGDARHYLMIDTAPCNFLSKEDKLRFGVFISCDNLFGQLTDFN